MKLKFKTFKSKSDNIKNIHLSYLRHNNGNAEIYLYFFKINILIYINGLKKHKKNYITLITN